MSDMAPTVAHCLSLPARRGGRCACGPAKPVPRPLLEKIAPMLLTACGSLAIQLKRSRK